MIRIADRLLRLVLRQASAWRTVDARDVGAIARRRKIERCEKWLRELGHHQVAAMLERDEDNYSARNIGEAGSSGR